VPNGGLIVPLSTSAETHRTRIVALADRHRLPAVYPSRVDAAIGGLISYGPDQVDQCRRSAGYVDRILNGDKPADLPVQAPTKYELEHVPPQLNQGDSRGAEDGRGYRH